MAKKPTPVKSAPKSSVKVFSTPTDDPRRLEPEGWMKYTWVVLAITAICYLPSLQNKLVNWDDDPNITENPNLERLAKGGSWGEFVGNIFDLDKGNVIGNYNPLPIFTFGIEHALAGDFNTTLIHFTNLLLHLLTVFFAMRLLFRMGFGNWGAFIGGLLFGIHPMRVESVAWATERKDVLFAVFFFAALVYYVRWIKEEESSKKVPQYLIMVLLATLSGFSKVQAVTLPLSMLVLDYWFRRPINFRLIWEKIPFWGISLAIGLINLYTLKQQGSTDDDLTNFNFVDRLCIGTYSFGTYLYKLFIPYPMSPLYPYPKPLPIWVYLSPILFVAVWFGIWRMWKSDRRIWVAGMLFFFFNVMFLLQVLGAGQGYLADRFTYVPYFGLFAIIAWLADQYAVDSKTRSNVLTATSIIGLVFAIITFIQIGVWKNGETLWTHVIKYEQKTNSLPYWNRAQYYRAQGKYQASLEDYTQAITINPDNPELYNSRGKTYFDMAMSGKFKPQEKNFMEKALADYTAGLSKGNKKAKTHAELLINRGAAMGASNRLQEAIDDMTNGLKLDPENKNGYFNRSIAYMNAGQLENALGDYNTYLTYDPYNSNILYESGMVLRTLNRNEEAIANLTKALQIDPKLAIAYLERARAQSQAGNAAAARNDYQRAQQMGVQLAPQDLAKLNGQ